MSDKKQGHDFSVGQKVRCIRGSDVGTPRIKEGEIYEVTRFDPDYDIVLYLDGYNENGHAWLATRFEPVEEEHPDPVVEAISAIKRYMDTLGVPDDVESLREEIKDLEDSRDIQAKTFNEIREHLSAAAMGTSGNVADCVKEALDALVGRRDHWKAQARIARTKGEHKSDRISDLLRERDRLERHLAAAQESINKWREKATKLGDPLRERDSLRDEAETKDAIIAKKIVKYRRLKAKHFDAIDEARRLRERLDCLKASTVGTESAQRLVDMWKDRAERVEGKEKEIQARYDALIKSLQVIKDPCQQIADELFRIGE